MWSDGGCERTSLGGSDGLRLRYVQQVRNRFARSRQDRHGRPPAFDTLLPFGTVGYRRVEKPAHKLASRGAKCILLGTAGPHDVNDHRPCGTFRVRDLTTGAIIWRQAVTWHPAAGAGGDTPLAAATGGG